MNRPRKSSFSLRIAAALLCFVTAAAAQLPASLADQTLRYAAKHRGFAVGTATFHIRDTDYGVAVATKVAPNALGAMFSNAKRHTSETRLVRRDDGLQLYNGYEKLSGEDAYLRAFELERDDAGRPHRIRFTNSEAPDKSLDLQPDDTFAVGAYPLLLVQRDADELAALADARVWEVGFRRLREYQYHAPVAERVVVPAGEFAARKITRHRVDRPHDVVSVWLRLEPPDNLPLKILYRKKGRDSTLELLLTPP